MKISEKRSEKQWVKSGHHFFIPDSVNDGGRKPNRRPRARRKNVSSASITFAQLKQCMADRVDQPGFPRKASLPNLLSALNAFLNDLGLDPSHAVGTTLRVGYYKAVEGHISRLREQGHTSAYIANRKSLLKSWRKLVAQLDRESSVQNGSMTPLQAALQNVLDAGATIKGLAREARIPFSTLQRLCRGGAPTRRSMRYLRRLECFLGMAEGALTDLVGGGRVAGSDSTAATESISYRV